MTVAGGRFTDHDATGVVRLVTASLPARLLFVGLRARACRPDAGVV